jgi:flagellar FliJ protein
MKKFKYRLETMLKLKEHAERERQKDHARAMGDVHRQKEKLAEIGSARERAVDYQRQQVQKHLSIVTMLSCSRYLLRLKGETMLGREALTGLERTAEKKRQRLVEAARQRRIYERLREKQKERYYEEIEHTETVQLNEIALNNHAHRARNR